MLAESKCKFLCQHSVQTSDYSITKQLNRKAVKCEALSLTEETTGICQPVVY